MAARPRITVIAALATIVVLAWAYLFHLARDMSGMRASEMALSGNMIWTPIDFIMMFLMWAVMMVGMMIPSAMPAIVIFDKWNMSRKTDGQSFGTTGLFTAGYIIAWVIFSLFATLSQWALDQSGWLDPMMESKSPYLGAILLISAGLYQLTPYKDVCLTHCQSPIEFIGKHWKPGGIEAFKLGVRHGIYCIGCCWLIMGLLFFFGVMNLIWIFILGLFVLLEKLVIFNQWINGAVSGILITSGIILLI
ncbi:hypothetical protein MNBD_ALPHA02-2359 [hydrothermal vent metagenome]|uniref:Transmembrane protein n=1 Tax=hydrothermal vent metagenome TaxID=652676 RepID=A0A3B0S2Y3_9ZZZZ